ncbi:hypothetical protein L218DRAFT_1039214 [Marasmius fiardii PR-910]|nr:hypothetical protein L218DRAFT_1039214 [Marasmius fiardii PR-910]
MALPSETELYRLTVTVWIPLQLASLGAVVLIQTIALAGGLVRGRVWYGFMVSCAIASLSSCILYFFGQQPTKKGETPEYAVCLVQAALMKSDFPLMLMMALSLLLELYWKVWAMFSHNWVALESRSKSPLLLILPYLLWFILVGAHLAFGLIKRSTVTFDGLRLPFCVFDHPVPTLALLAAAMVLLAIIAIFLLEYRSQPEFKHSQHLQTHTFLFIRFALIWAAGTSAMVITIMFSIHAIASVVYYFVVHAGGQILFSAAKLSHYITNTLPVPLMIVIIFGSQVVYHLRLLGLKQHNVDQFRLSFSGYLVGMWKVTSRILEKTSQNDGFLRSNGEA